MDSPIDLTKVSQGRVSSKFNSEISSGLSSGLSSEISSGLSSELREENESKEMTWLPENGHSYRVLYLRVGKQWVRYSETQYAQPAEYGQGGWTTYQYLHRKGWRIVPTELVNPLMIQSPISEFSLSQNPSQNPSQDKLK